MTFDFQVLNVRPYSSRYCTFSAFLHLQILLSWFLCRQAMIHCAHMNAMVIAMLSIHYSELSTYGPSRKKGLGNSLMAHPPGIRSCSRKTHRATAEYCQCWRREKGARRDVTGVQRSEISRRRTGKKISAHGFIT